MNPRRGFLKKMSVLLMGLDSFTPDLPPRSVVSGAFPPASIDRLRVAFVLFNGITALDFVGFYDPITRLKSQGYIPNLSWDLCSFTETVQDSFGLTLTPTRVRQSLDAYDMVFVPGGLGTRMLQTDKEFLNWLRTAQNVPSKISVCTGSLLLGAAGFLNERKATTNFKEYETLKQYCPAVQKARIVDDQDVITGGAVASSLDLGLYVCEKLVGTEAKEAIRATMDYPKFEVQVKK
jgi:transcriptional regulator GlxA family with amidase domain